MAEEQKGDVMKVCEMCKKEVKESDGVMVLSGSAFECNECIKKEEHAKHGEDDGVCKFC